MSSAPADQGRLDWHVLLVRHGRTVLNAGGRIRGHLDPPLDDVGKTQAAAVASALAYLQPTRVVTSPLRRAVQTAQTIAALANLEPIVEPRLIDRDYGQCAGRSWDEVVAQWGSLDRAPGVEQVDGVTARLRAVLEDQAQYLGAGPVILVAHDAVNRLLLHSLDPELGPTEEIGQDLACWNVLLRRDMDWLVLQINQTVTRT